MEVDSESDTNLRRGNRSSPKESEYTFEYLKKHLFEETSYFEEN